MEATVPSKTLVSSHQTRGSLLASGWWHYQADTSEQFTCTAIAVAAQQMKQNKYPALATSCTQTKVVPTLTGSSLAKNYHMTFT
jgi:hypothetical protein